MDTEVLVYYYSNSYFLPFQMPEEPPVSKTLTQDQIEEMRKEASSALHGDTMAYETSKLIQIILYYQAK